MREKLDRYSRQLLEQFRECQYTDILGFGNILGVNDDQDFDDYLTDIIVQYQGETRSKRKALLKLAKDVAAANKNMIANPDLIKVSPIKGLNKIRGKRATVGVLDDYRDIDKREIVKEKAEQVEKFLGELDSTPGDSIGKK